MQCEYSLRLSRPVLVVGFGLFASLLLVEQTVIAQEIPAFPESGLISGSVHSNDSVDTMQQSTLGARFKTSEASADGHVFRSVGERPQSNNSDQNPAVVSSSYHRAVVNNRSDLTSQNAGTVSQVAASPMTPLSPPGPSNMEARPQGKSTFQMLLSVGSSLMIVIGIFLGCTWLYRKSLGVTKSGGLPKNVVQVLGRTPMATRQQLVLLRFGSKLVLVSTVHGETRTISEITDPMEVDRLSGLCESHQPGSISSSFREILAQGVRA